MLRFKVEQEQSVKLDIEFSKRFHSLNGPGNSQLFTFVYLIRFLKIY